MVTFLRPSSLNSPLILSCFLSCPTPLAKLYSVLNVYRSSCFLPHGLISPETDDTLFEFPFPGKLFQESPNQPWSWKELKPGKIPPQRPQRGPSSQYKSKNMTVFSACQQLLPMPFYSQGSQQVIPLCQQFVPPQGNHAGKWTVTIAKTKTKQSVTTEKDLSCLRYYKY